MTEKKAEPTFKAAAKHKMGKATRSLFKLSLKLGLAGVSSWLILSAGQAGIEAGAARLLKNLVVMGVQDVAGSVRSGEVTKIEHELRKQEAKQQIKQWQTEFQRNWPKARNTYPYGKALTGAAFAVGLMIRRKAGKGMQKKPHHKPK
jgi:glutamate 5-kinase